MRDIPQPINACKRPLLLPNSPLIVSFCHDVERSRFINDQVIFPSFSAMIEDLREDFVDAQYKEELPLFSPAEYAGAGSRRANITVLRLGFLVIDIDKGTERELEPALSKIVGYGHFIYTSFSHATVGQQKFRVIVKLTRPVDISEWASFWIRAMSRFGLLHLADPNCKDPARLYYVPGGDRQKYQCLGDDGPALDVDAILADPLPAGVAEPETDNFQEVLDEKDRGAISEGLKDYWEAKLQHLCDNIRRRPYPGSIYDLKNNEVYSISRGIPHIVKRERFERMVLQALKYRYDKAERNGHDTTAHALASEKTVMKAMADGESKPYYPPKCEDVPAHELNEFGLRDRLVAAHGDDLSWVEEWEKWSVWTGKFWDTAAGNARARERMVETIRRIPEEAAALEADRWNAKEHYESVKDDPNVSEGTKGAAETAFETIDKQVKGIHKFANGSKTNGKVIAGVRLASSEQRVLTHYDRFDRSKHLLNFRNGTVDLRTGQLSAHKRSDYISKIVPYDYRPDAKAPRWDQFLDESMLGRKRLVQLLLRIAGYSLLGLTTEQILVMCIGDGANGKSTFLQTLLALVGSDVNGYGFAANSENLLTTKGGNRHETWRMSLHAKRVVVCEEVEEGRNFAESLVKELTGSTLITGRKMRQDEWSFEPEFQLWLAANQLPAVRGTDEGIWRRLMVIPWDASFRGRADPKLGDKLRREAPGILAQLVREAGLYLQEGLQVPREVRVASEQYRREQDPLGPFFERYCVTNESEAFTEGGVLWAAYLQWAETSRDQVFKQRKRFFAAVGKRFPKHKPHRGARGFRGIRVMVHTERLAATPEARLQRHEQDFRREGESDDADR